MNDEGEAVKEAADVRVTSRARYLHPLVHYETVYSRKVRALKGLIAIGRDANPPELPPFDDPPRMRDWWIRHMKQRVPDDIARHAVPHVPQTPAPAPDAAVGPLFAAAPAIVSAAPESVAGSGYEAALQRMRAAEASAGALYDSLLRQAADGSKSPEQRAALAADAEAARRAWDDLVNRLRTMEKDAAEILSASGRMWLAADVIAANDAMHLVLRESMRGLLRRVRPKLAGKEPGEQDVIWDHEVEGMFAGLRENKFTAPAVVADAA